MITTTLDDSTLALPIHGSNLGAASTIDQLLEEASILAFLRHGG